MEKYLEIIDSCGIHHNYGKKIDSFRYLSDVHEMIEFMDVNRTPICWYPEREIDHLVVVEEKEEVVGI